MSRIDSNLTSPKYGYDFVIATTQESINATMKEYLSSMTQSQVVMLYVMDEQGNPQQIEYDALLKATNGTDPFSVPEDTPLSDPRMKNLEAAFFMYAFKASIGLPPGYTPQEVPDVVALGANTASVTYNLLSSEFQVVEASYGPRGLVGWLNQSQEPGKAWIFTSQVDLRLSTADQSAYSKLPPAVQKQIKNLGGNAFSVQQLLFDLDNAALESIPKICGVTAGTPLHTALEQSFLGAYFSTMRANGEPVLGYSITQSAPPPSTLTLTDLNLQVNPFVGSDGQPVEQPSDQQLNLATLNYLCAANGDVLPAAAPFTWNWVEVADQASADGVVAINRNVLAGYFRGQLMGLVSRNCFQPKVRVWISGFNIHYRWSLTPNQTPTVTIPATGPLVLHFTYNGFAEDDAGVLGVTWGKMSLSPSLDVQVSFSGNTITIVQHLVIHLYVKSQTESKSGNVVDRTITDTYTLAVDQSGHLTSTLTTANEDHSQNPSTNGFLDFWTGINQIIDDVKNWSRNFVATRFSDIPLSILQGFVFPGGKTFTYKDVVFSSNQDLVSRVTYVQPS